MLRILGTLNQGEPLPAPATSDISQEGAGVGGDTEWEQQQAQSLKSSSLTPAMKCVFCCRASPQP